jgi:hypothetical protein
MNLYIKVENGQTINHPILESNLLQTFVDGVIPPEYEKFERIPYDSSLKKTDYQVAKCYYVKNENGVWQDSWVIEDLVGEEKDKKTQELIDIANEAIKRQKAFAEQMIVSCISRSDLDGVVVWNEYINILNAWKLISVCPTTPSIPNLPVMDFENKWVQFPAYGK